MRPSVTLNDVILLSGLLTRLRMAIPFAYVGYPNRTAMGDQRTCSCLQLCIRQQRQRSRGGDVRHCLEVGLQSVREKAAVD